MRTGRNLIFPLLLLSTFLLSGCASRPPVLDPNGLKNESVLFDTVKLDANRMHGVFVKSIDGLSPYMEQSAFRRVYADTSQNSLAWIMSPGTHRLTLNYHDSATIMGRTSRSQLSVTIEMADGGLYLPETRIDGDMVEWRLVNTVGRDSYQGPWHTPVERGLAFFLLPFMNQTFD